jgi:hypothetical protein
MNRNIVKALLAVTVLGMTASAHAAATSSSTPAPRVDQKCFEYLHRVGAQAAQANLDALNLGMVVDSCSVNGSQAQMKVHLNRLVNSSSSNKNTCYDFPKASDKFTVDMSADDTASAKTIGDHMNKMKAMVEGKKVKSQDCPKAPSSTVTAGL